MKITSATKDLYDHGGLPIRTAVKYFLDVCSEFDKTMEWNALRRYVDLGFPISGVILGYSVSTKVAALM